MNAQAGKAVKETNRVRGNRRTPFLMPGILLPIAILLLMLFSACKNPTVKDPAKGSTEAKGKTAETLPHTKKTASTSDQKIDSTETIPASMKNDGFISASVFQVFITVFGSDESEARSAGLNQGLRKALNIIRHHPSMRGKRLSRAALNELRMELQANAKIVALRRKSSGAWDVVLRIERENLKSYIRRLR